MRSPGTNAAGNTINVGSHGSAVGKMTNATFRLYPATSDCTYCAKTSNGTYAYLQTIRGTYSPTLVLARSRYHVGWGNDFLADGPSHQRRSWASRWEEQWYDGNILNYLFNDNWSPRLGVNWDPQGRSQDEALLQLCPLPVGSAARCRHSPVGQ
ncbi:MAG: hypothetical protein WDM87_16560 [Terracidiphilus sp.]